MIPNLVTRGVHKPCIYVTEEHTDQYRSEVKISTTTKKAHYSFTHFIFKSCKRFVAVELGQ